MKEIIILFLILILVLLVVSLVFAKGDRKKISIINSENKTIYLDIEVANNSATKAKGLMGRTSLGENKGMLFIFDKPGKYGFWMLNTSISLDAIHFDENGTVVDIVSMEPCGLINCKNYYPKNNSKYVLEVNSGFAKKNKIIIGKGNLILD